MEVNYKLQNKPSKIDGLGAYALETIPARRKIGNLAGEIISLREARKRSRNIERVAMVEFGDGRANAASLPPTLERRLLGTSPFAASALVSARSYELTALIHPDCSYACRTQRCQRI